jgi:D-alanyl-D-alanine carboxypeptidase
MMKKLLCLLLCLLPLAALAEDESAVWDYPVSYSILQNEEGYLTLASPDRLLSSDYVPDDLVKIKAKKTSSTAIQMRTVASEKLSAMFDAAKADGVTLYAHSGYRSYRTQKTMYSNRLASMGYDDGAVAYPGSSDHQTGLGVDVISKAWIGKRFNEKFATTKEAKWMAEHCAEYGYIIRYPEDKTEITKIMYEPWHLRYVGEEAAKYIMESGLCLEEFTEEYESFLAAFSGNPESAENSETAPLDANEVVIGISDDGDEEVTLFGGVN